MLRLQERFAGCGYHSSIVGGSHVESWVLLGSCVSVSPKKNNFVDNHRS